eukprot:GHVL01018695.1.p1 GENE.GHVL01018695.1~~GHVL01018695.1.p1  ORF type:complete len:110 (-),score=5.98 GHVL01018695.1:210-539(-)
MVNRLFLFSCKDPPSSYKFNQYKCPFDANPCTCTGIPHDQRHWREKHVQKYTIALKRSPKYRFHKCVEKKVSFWPPDPNRVKSLECKLRFAKTVNVAFKTKQTCVLLGL